MKTTLFTLLFALIISVASTQPTRRTTPSTQEPTVSIWVWSIQGQSTYQEPGYKMARPLSEGTLLSKDADIWVSDNGQVVLLYNGTSTALGKGAHSVHDLIMTTSGKVASGFSQGAAPSPTGGGVSGHGDDGSGFGQGAPPPPAGSEQDSRGNDGSGFGQDAPGGTPPAPVEDDDIHSTVHRPSGDGLVPNPSLDFLNWISRHREAGSGFSDGAAPPPTSGGISGRGDDGSGFGQGAAPAPTGGTERGRGDEGSGFGQGAAPAPTGGAERGRGDEGSGFGQGAAPAPTGGAERGRGDEGSGFSDGTAPSPTGGGLAGRGDDGSGFGDGITTAPQSSGGLSQNRDTKMKTVAVTNVAFLGEFAGNVTLGPVDFIWTPPGENQTCQFKIWNKNTPQKPLYQVNTSRSGIILDLRDLNLKNGENYVATISLASGSATARGTVNFTVVGPEIQLKAFQQAKANGLYPIASPAHRAILNAMELEKAKLNTAATVQYQRAYELDPNSDLVNAMIYNFKMQHGLIEKE
ncbi:MAG: hypothetical protein K9I85_11000 [Saprospiraceae bacterium]|nr:hypothetical protein [Saprospiraceae bacterium]